MFRSSKSQSARKSAEKSTRPASLTGTKQRSSRSQNGEWEDLDAQSEVRSRTSSHTSKKKHTKQRSRSRSRDRTARSERDERRETRWRERQLGSVASEPIHSSSTREQVRGFDGLSEAAGTSNLEQPLYRQDHPLWTEAPRAPLSSHIQDQFPGQDPSDYSHNPYNAVSSTMSQDKSGSASDYYSVQALNPETTGPSIKDTPSGNTEGVLRISKPPSGVFIGPGRPLSNYTPEQSKQTWSNPPSMSGVSGNATSNSKGEASSYYDATVSMTPSRPSVASQPQLYHSISSPAVPTASYYAPPPSTNKPTGQPYAAVSAYPTAAGAAAIAAGAFAVHEHNQHHTQHYASSIHVNHPEEPQSILHEPAMSSSYAHSPPTMAQAHRQRRRGPVDRLLDILQNKEDIRKMEEYTEYIGVCRYCFDPTSSAQQAPRQHHFHGRRSGESLQKRSSESLRAAHKRGSKHAGVDKDSRYYSSDSSHRSRKRSSWVGAGLAGYGLAKVSAALWDRKSSLPDTSSIRSGRYENPPSYHSGGRTSRTTERGIVHDSPNHAYEFVRHKDGTVMEAVRSHHRGSNNQVHQESHIGASSNGAFVRRRQHDQASSSGSDSPGLGEILGFTQRRKPHRRRRPSPSGSPLGSRRPTRSENGMLKENFSAEHGNPKREKKSMRGFFNFANDSSSSAASDLAFGSSVGQSSNYKRPSKKRSKDNLNATMFKIGATAAALTAAQATHGRRRPEIVAVRERKNKQSAHERMSTASRTTLVEDEWESASDDDSVSAASDLAFGDFHESDEKLRRRASAESITSQSSDLSKWGWRWGGKGKRRADENRRPPLQARLSDTLPQSTWSPTPQELESAMGSSTTRRPMQVLSPEPVEELPYSMPGAFIPEHQSAAFRPAPAPLQHPQPTTPVRPDICSEGTHADSTYSAPVRASTFPTFTQDDVRRPRRNSNPSSRNFVRDAAIVGAAAVATAGIVSANRSSKEGSPTGVRFDLTDKQARKQEQSELVRNAKQEALRQAAERDRREDEKSRRFDREESQRHADSARREAEQQAEMDREDRKQRREARRQGRPENSASPVIERTDASARELELEAQIERKKRELEERARYVETRTPFDLPPSIRSASDVHDNIAPRQDRAMTEEPEHEVETMSPDNVHSGEPILDDEIFDPDFFKRPRSESEIDKYAEIARKVTARIVSENESKYTNPQPTQAQFFYPDILSQNGQTKKVIANVEPDTDYQINYVDVDRNTPVVPLGVDYGKKPWSIPSLKVIAPTPPTSTSGSIKGQKSPDASPIVEMEEDEKPSPPSTPKASNNRVSWGPDDTRIYNIGSPEVSPAVPPLESDPRDEIVVDVEDPGNEHTDRYVVDDLPNTSRSSAQAPHVFIEELARQAPDVSTDQGFYRSPFFETVSDLGIAIDPPSVQGTSAEQGFVIGEIEEQTPIEEKLSHMPGGFDFDGDGESRYQAEDRTRSDSAPRDPQNVEDGSTKPIESKLQEERPAEQEDQWDRPLSKKDKKKQEKAARQSITEDESVVRDVPIDPFPEPTPTKAILEDVWEPPLSKKERKKREKAALLSNREDDFQEREEQLATPSGSQPAETPIDDAWEPPLSKKDRKKREKAAQNSRDDYFADRADPMATPDELQRFETPLEQSREPPLSKKEQKKRDKARQSNREDDTTPLETPALASSEARQIETPYEDAWEAPLSKKEQKKRDKAAKRMALDDQFSAESPTLEERADKNDYNDTSALRNDRQRDMPRERDSKAFHDQDIQDLSLVDAPEPPAPEEDVWEPLLSKKEQKKREKAARLAEATEAKSSPSVAEDNDEWDIPLSSKERKKRAKEAKKGGFSDTVAAVMAGGTTVAALTGSSRSAIDEPSQQDKHDREPTVEVPVDAYDDLLDNSLPARGNGLARITEDEEEKPKEDSPDRARSSESPTETTISAPNNEESRRRKKKHRSSVDFDDDASFASGHTSRSSRRGDDEPKKDKKGGIFGLFRRKSSDKDSNPEERQPVDDDDEKSHKRHHRRHGTGDSDSKSVASSTRRFPRDDPDEGSSHRRHRYPDDEDDDARSSYSTTSRHRDKSRLRDNADDVQEDQSFLGKRVEAEEPPALPADLTIAPTLAPESVAEDTNVLSTLSAPSDSQLTSTIDPSDEALTVQLPVSPLQETVPGHAPEISDTPSITAKAMDEISAEFALPPPPESGPSSSMSIEREASLMPLPDSRPSSPVQHPYSAAETDSATELPPLPTSPVHASPSMHHFHTPRRPMLPIRPSSSTTVPLRFRRPPGSPGLSVSPATPRERAASFGSPLPQSPISPISLSASRSGHRRGRSSEMRHFTEFQPLYLVEHNRKPQKARAEEEQLPSLPSSKPTSRASSIQDNEEYESASEELPGQERPFLAPLKTGDFQDDHNVGKVLGSEHSTPRASQFPAENQETVPRAEPEFYSWEDMLREENMRSNAAAAALDKDVTGHPPEPLVESHDLESIDIDGVTTTAEHHEKPIVRNLDGFQKPSEVSEGLVATFTDVFEDERPEFHAALEQSSATESAHQSVPQTTEQPVIQSERSGETTSFGEGTTADDDFTTLTEPVQERPLLDRKSSKKTKKGKKGKSQKLGTATVSSNEPEYVPAAELARRQQQDTEDALDSWHEAPTSSKATRSEGEQNSAEDRDEAMESLQDDPVPRDAYDQEGLAQPKDTVPTEEPWFNTPPKKKPKSKKGKRAADFQEPENHPALDNSRDIPTHECDSVTGQDMQIFEAHAPQQITSLQQHTGCEQDSLFKDPANEKVKDEEAKEDLLEAREPEVDPAPENIRGEFLSPQTVGYEDDPAAEENIASSAPQKDIVPEEDVKPSHDTGFQGDLSPAGINVPSQADVSAQENDLIQGEVSPREEASLSQSNSFQAGTTSQGDAFPKEDVATPENSWLDSFSSSKKAKNKKGKKKAVEPWESEVEQPSDVIPLVEGMPIIAVVDQEDPWSENPMKFKKSKAKKGKKNAADAWDLEPDTKEAPSLEDVTSREEVSLPEHSASQQDLEDKTMTNVQGKSNTDSVDAFPEQVATSQEDTDIWNEAPTTSKKSKGKKNKKKAFNAWEEPEFDPISPPAVVPTEELGSQAIDDSQDVAGQGRPTPEDIIPQEESWAEFPASSKNAKKGKKKAVEFWEEPKTEPENATARDVVPEDVDPQYEYSLAPAASKKTKGKKGKKRAFVLWDEPQPDIPDAAPTGGLTPQIQPDVPQDLQAIQEAELEAEPSDHLSTKPEPIVLTPSVDNSGKTQANDRPEFCVNYDAQAAPTADSALESQRDAAEQLSDSKTHSDDQKVSHPFIQPHLSIQKDESSEQHGDGLSAFEPEAETRTRSEEPFSDKVSNLDPVPGSDQRQTTRTSYDEDNSPSLRANRTAGIGDDELTTGDVTESAHAQQREQFDVSLEYDEGRSILPDIATDDANDTSTGNLIASASPPVEDKPAASFEHNEDRPSDLNTGPAKPAVDDGSFARDVTDYESFKFSDQQPVSLEHEADQPFDGEIRSKEPTRYNEGSAHAPLDEERAVLETITQPQDSSYTPFPAIDATEDLPSKRDIESLEDVPESGNVGYEHTAVDVEVPTIAPKLSKKDKKKAKKIQSWSDDWEPTPSQPGDDFERPIEQVSEHAGSITEERSAQEADKQDDWMPLPKKGKKKSKKNQAGNDDWELSSSKQDLEPQTPTQDILGSTEKITEEPRLPESDIPKDWEAQMKIKKKSKKAVVRSDDWDPSRSSREEDPEPLVENENEIQKTAGDDRQQEPDKSDDWGSLPKKKKKGKKAQAWSDDWDASPSRLEEDPEQSPPKIAGDPKQEKSEPNEPDDWVPMPKKISKKEKRKAKKAVDFEAGDREVVVPDDILPPDNKTPEGTIPVDIALLGSTESLNLPNDQSVFASPEAGDHQNHVVEHQEHPLKPEDRLSNKAPESDIVDAAQSVEPPSQVEAIQYSTLEAVMQSSVGTDFAETKKDQRLAAEYQEHQGRSRSPAPSSKPHNLEAIEEQQSPREQEGDVQTSLDSIDTQTEDPPLFVERVAPEDQPSLDLPRSSNQPQDQNSTTSSMPYVLDAPDDLHDVLDDQTIEQTTAETANTPIEGRLSPAIQQDSHVIPRQHSVHHHLRRSGSRTLGLLPGDLHSEHHSSREASPAPPQAVAHDAVQHRLHRSGSRNLDLLPGNVTPSRRSSRAASPVSSSQAPLDVDFAATLAAGLGEAGFDPDIVVNDPSFHRRASPPGVAETYPDDEFVPTTKKSKKKKKMDAELIPEASDKDAMKEPLIDLMEDSAVRRVIELPDEGNDKAGSDRDDGFDATLAASLGIAGFSAADMLARSAVAPEEPDEFTFATPKNKKKRKGKGNKAEEKEVASDNVDDAVRNSSEPATLSNAVDAAESAQDLQDAPSQETPAEDRWVFTSTKKSKKGRGKGKKIIENDAEEVDVPPILGDVVIEGEESADVPPGGATAEDEWALPSTKKNKKSKGRKAFSQAVSEPPTSRETMEANELPIEQESPMVVKKKKGKKNKKGMTFDWTADDNEAEQPLSVQEIVPEGGAQPDATDATEVFQTLPTISHKGQYAEFAQPSTEEPTWSFDNIRDSGLQVEASPQLSPAEAPRDVVRDSGYDTIRNSGIVATQEETELPELGNAADDSLDTWSLPVSKSRSKGKQPMREVESENDRQDKLDPEQTAPVSPESTTKNRASYLFNTPPTAEKTRARTAENLSSDKDKKTQEGDYFNVRTHESGPTPILEDMELQKQSPDDVRTSYTPLESPVRKRSKADNDMGFPSHEIKSARRSVTPVQSFRDRLDAEHRSSPHAIDIPSPLYNIGSPTSSIRNQRLASPTIDENRELSSIDDRLHGSELGRRYASGMRSPSVQSYASNGMVRPLRSPDQLRSASAASNRSLKRTDRSMSGDLRAAARRGEPPLPAPSQSPAPTSNINTRPSFVNTNIPPLPFQAPLTPPLNEAEAAAARMANVYEGWGDGERTTVSPTRPPSARKRQSMHLMDMEAKVNQLTEENRRLQQAQGQANRSAGDFSNEEYSDLREALENTEVELREKDVQITQIRALLDPLQEEVSRLTEINENLGEANHNLIADTNDRYATLQSEHAHAHEQWQQSSKELQSLRQKHVELSSGMEDIVRQHIDQALEDKNAEIQSLREELETATSQIRTLQSQIQRSASSDDYLQSKSEDYFDNACQKLCQHIQQWILRFSKSSDNRACRLSDELNDDKLEARLDNVMLDGSDVDKFLVDRIRRRDVFMSLTMSMVWEYIFTRYLFGMDREQRQKLKSLEKTLLEVGPARAVAQWRATTLTLLSQRPQFATQRALDTEAVTHEIFATLSALLPPPSALETQLLSGLKKVLRLAIDLAVEFRVQKPEYLMLPPPTPEYDAQGDLVRKTRFEAGTMNERSGEWSDNQELVDQGAVLKMVLFPLVMKKGDDYGEGGDETVICPAQVLVAGERGGKRVRMDLDVSSLGTGYGGRSRLSVGSMGTF